MVAQRDKRWTYSPVPRGLHGSTHAAMAEVKLLAGTQLGRPPRFVSIHRAQQIHRSETFVDRGAQHLRREGHPGARSAYDSSNPILRKNPSPPIATTSAPATILPSISVRWRRSQLRSAASRANPRWSWSVARWL